MDPKVKEFIDAAKSKERAKFEKERDAHLIRLGLVKKETRKTYDGVSYIPLDVTDEEYAEIKKITEEKPNEDIKIENGAENFLAVFNGIFLGIGILASVILLIAAIDGLSYGDDEGVVYLLSSIGVLLVSIISWNITRVLLNISNNLHKINAKLK